VCQENITYSNFKVPNILQVVINYAKYAHTNNLVITKAVAIT
jgi:hypothetical protein